jgi:dTDP-4-dehydrorhamnose 3,5-epimerase-like enzyme
MLEVKDMELQVPEIINFPKILDRRGNLSFLESYNQIPFEIKRAFWIYDVPGGVERGGHAYLESIEVVIAMSGSFDVIINDGNTEYIYSLNRSYYGLFIPKMMWRQMKNFSTNSLALVLTSTIYDKNDYIFNFEYFKKLRLKEHKSNLIINDKSSLHFNSISLNKYDKKNTVFDCSLFEFDKHTHENGNITVIENFKSIPFGIKRIYYLYDIPGGEERGGHAHKKLFQLIVSVSGSFDVVLYDGYVKRTITLNRPYQGLMIVPGLWRELNNFSSGSVCLVLASEKYDENDYIRNYDDYQNFVKN